MAAECVLGMLEVSFEIVIALDLDNNSPVSLFLQLGVQRIWTRLAYETLNALNCERAC